MAKKNRTISIIDGENTITINPKSKNLTYTYSGDGIYTLNFVADFKYMNKGIEKDILGYNECYKNFATKSNNDLIITTIFITDSGKTKKVISTVKNFFLDDTKDYKVKYKTHYPNSAVSENLSTLTIKPDTEYGTNGLYNISGVENDYYINYLLGTNKKDTHEFSDDYFNYIYEPKGNDKYLSQHANKTDYIYDLAGNDEYKILQDGTSSGIMYSYDYSGKDEYTADGQYARLYSKDYSGNDDYELKNGAKFWVDDYEGNDEYEVNANKSDADTSNRRINDYKGNDEYELINATVDIVDHGGKDKYEIKNNTSENILSITDNSKSKDKYEVSNSVDLVAGNLSVYDAAGNDKHNWTNVKFSTWADEGSYAIKDENGNDKYTLRSVKNIRIYDGGGKDYYNLKSNYNSNNADMYVNNFQIIDKGNKNDKYDLQFVACEYTEDDETSRTIIDDGGNDKYNLASSTNIRINDKSGNDTYNLKAPVDKKGKKIKFEGEDVINSLNSSVIIYDDKGNDKYNISYLMNGTIVDSEGKDTYNIKGSTLSYDLSAMGYGTTNIPSVSMSKIHDASLTSSDTYNISNATGYPMMIAIGDLDPFIRDDGGNNKFNIKNSGKSVDLKAYSEAYKNKDTITLTKIIFTIPTFTIKCTGIGDDKYNISNSVLLTTISDNSGKDKYNFKNVLGSVIVNDNEGNDRYTISKNKAGIIITDNSGDDSYILDNLKRAKVGTLEGNSAVIIDDKSGKDTLKIKSLNKSNIVYMTNFSDDVEKNYINDEDFGLIIYDKKNGGFVNLVDFYSADETSITGFGNGVIETFKAGKKSINLQSTSACNYTKMESIRAEVGAWLSEDGRNYDSVQDVLTSSNTTDINELVKIFQTGSAN